MTPRHDIEGALFRTPAPILDHARSIIERETGETNPIDVVVTWLGIGTALVAWSERDGTPHTLTVTGDDARELHSLEGGSTSFPPRCHAEHIVDGQVVRCGLRSPHFPLRHDDLEGTVWSWPNG